MSNDKDCSNLDLFSEIAQRIVELEDRVTLMSTVVAGLLKAETKKNLITDEGVIKIMESEGCTWDEAVKKIIINNEE